MRRIIAWFGERPLTFWMPQFCVLAVFASSPLLRDAFGDWWWAAIPAALLLPWTTLVVAFWAGYSSGGLLLVILLLCALSAERMLRPIAEMTVGEMIGRVRGVERGG